jgi:hypothetical protein
VKRQLGRPPLSALWEERFRYKTHHLHLLPPPKKNKKQQVKYKITSRRISVTSGVGGKDLTEVIYPDIAKVNYVFRCVCCCVVVWLLFFFRCVCVCVCVVLFSRCRVCLFVFVCVCGYW